MKDSKTQCLFSKKEGVVNSDVIRGRGYIFKFWQNNKLLKYWKCNVEFHEWKPLAHAVGYNQSGAKMKPAPEHASLERTLVRR